MDSYLELAERVLTVVRRPLTPRQILKIAYERNEVPQSLYGKTQHKTLGARLSVDIVRRRERSDFFRTKPGHFFLSKFMRDPQIDPKHRVPMVARRRARDLFRNPILTLDIEADGALGNGQIAVHDVWEAVRAGKYSYIDRDEIPESKAPLVWSFVVFTKGSLALSYRLGRYREDRDVFALKRSIGFYAAVSEADANLFNIDDLGVMEAGVQAVSMDLDMPWSVSLSKAYRSLTQLRTFYLHKGDDGRANLLSVIQFECPEWFEPLGKRLAINDLKWLDLSVKVNHPEDFDPWSRRVLEGWNT